MYGKGLRSFILRRHTRRISGFLFPFGKRRLIFPLFSYFFFFLSVLSSAAAAAVAAAAAAAAAAAILSHVARLAKTMLLYIWQYAIALYIQCTFTSQEQP